MTEEEQTLCSQCFDELHCERIINIVCQVKCQRCGRECLGYVTDPASTTKAEGRE